MVRELIDFYIDSKITPKLAEVMTKQEFREKSLNKLDSAIFSNYVKDQLQKEATNDREFKVDERLFTIEQKLEHGVSKEEFKAQLKLKASNERLMELRENIHKM